MPRKELGIDRCMEYSQSRLIDWDHVAEVKQDLLANPPDGRLQLLGWDDKGMALLCHNSMNSCHLHVVLNGQYACGVLDAAHLSCDTTLDPHLRGGLNIVAGPSNIAALHSFLYGGL